MIEVVITLTQGHHQHSPQSLASHLEWAPLMASKHPQQVHLGILEASTKLLQVNLMVVHSSKCGAMTRTLKLNQAPTSL
jgi:hypothetical protein